MKTTWADAGNIEKFIRVKTYSSYRSSRVDLQGVEHHTSPEISDQELGVVVLDAWAHSPFVLPEPRKDVWILSFEPQSQINELLFSNIF